MVDVPDQNGLGHTKVSNNPSAPCGRGLQELLAAPELRVLRVVDLVQRLGPDVREGLALARAPAVLFFPSLALCCPESKRSARKDEK